MRQKFGQHFLASAPVLDKIARLICGDASPRVLEIGPGRGVLTERLIACASHVTAIEIDRELVVYLKSRFAACSNFELVEGDALEVDWAGSRPDVIAGNLPYYVATPLIDRTVRSGLPGVFLIQKEVAERLAARPGSRDYGYLSVATQLFADVRLEFVVPPGAFRPPPKVDSAVVSLRPVDRRLVTDIEGFLSFLSACFRQKRKTLRNNLRGTYDIEGQAEPALRAEQLPLEALARLWSSVRANSPHGS